MSFTSARTRRRSSSSIGSVTSTPPVVPGDFVEQFLLRADGGDVGLLQQRRGDLLYLAAEPVEARLGR